MAELVRVFHSLTVVEAQTLVDALAERRIPLIWQSTDVTRVLDPTLTIQDQLLLLVASAPGRVSVDDLYVWLDYGNRAYFTRMVKKLHRLRLLNLYESNQQVELLPPGAKRVEGVVQAHAVAGAAPKRAPRRHR